MYRVPNKYLFLLNGAIGANAISMDSLSGSQHPELFAGARFELNDGQQMPVVGFGTWLVGDAPFIGWNPFTSAETVIDNALAAGYRMFDCAQLYENEHLTGKALKKAIDGGVVTRKDLYLVSKVWGDKIHAGPEAVKQQVQLSIADLRAQYLDLVLIHSPLPTFPEEHVAAYAALLEMKTAGFIRSVGVSNYRKEHIQQLIDAGLPLPAVNQIEINPWMSLSTENAPLNEARVEDIEFCQENGIRLMAYRGLGKGKLTDSEWATKYPIIKTLCDKYKVAPSQLLGRWLLQQGFVHIPKSENPGRMQQNIDLFDFNIAQADMTALESLTTDESVKVFEDWFKSRFYDRALDPAFIFNYVVRYLKPIGEQGFVDLTNESNLVAGSQNEAGCVGYELLRTNAGQYILFEGFTPAGIAQHGKEPHFKAWRPKIGQFSDESRGFNGGDMMQFKPAHTYSNNMNNKEGFKAFFEQNKKVAFVVGNLDEQTRLNDFVIECEENDIQVPVFKGLKGRVDWREYYLMVIPVDKMSNEALQRMFAEYNIRPLDFKFNQVDEVTAATVTNGELLSEDSNRTIPVVAEEVQVVEPTPTNVTIQPHNESTGSNKRTFSNI